jgi:prepilin-type N-terminal cleavage/methylation domain-containing protein
MLKNYKKNKEGFTIIEVLIVLAIAGLIMLIVLLAVPALTRNTRNTNRREDAGRIVTAINDYISNNGGTLPAFAAWNTAGTGEGTSIYTDAGKLAQYTDISVFDNTQTTPGVNNAFDLETGGITTGAVTADALILDLNGSCTGTGTSGAGTPKETTIAGSTPNAAVLLYSLEVAGGGPWNWACTTVD